MFGIPVNFTASLLHGWKFGGMMCDIFGFLLTLGGKYANVRFSAAYSRYFTYSENFE